MQFHQAGINFLEELFGFLTAMEAAKRSPYDAGDNVITIGVGYNLTSGTTALRDATFTQIGLKTFARNFAGTDASILSEKSYVIRLDAAIAAGPSGITSLNPIMAERAAKAASDPAFATYIGTSRPRANFQFSLGQLGIDEMKAVFAVGSVPYINSVNSQLGYTAQNMPAGFADSWEKVALVSLEYNGFNV